MVTFKRVRSFIIIKTFFYIWLDHNFITQCTFVIDILFFNQNIESIQNIYAYVFACVFLHLEKEKSLFLQIKKQLYMYML